MMITDEMIERAMIGYGTGVDWPATHRLRIRTALQAAFRGIPPQALVDVAVNRWDSFSDDEINEIWAAEADRSNSAMPTGPLPGEIYDIASKIHDELTPERNRRKGGYQGPGVYRAPDDSEWEVLHETEINGKTYVLGRKRRDTTIHVTELDDFNEPLEGGPRYCYLRALES